MNSHDFHPTAPFPAVAGGAAPGRNAKRARVFERLATGFRAIPMTLALMASCSGVALADGYATNLQAPPSPQYSGWGVPPQQPSSSSAYAPAYAPSYAAPTHAAPAYQAGTAAPAPAGLWNGYTQSQPPATPAWNSGPPTRLIGHAPDRPVHAEPPQGAPAAQGGPLTGSWQNTEGDVLPFHGPVFSQHGTACGPVPCGPVPCGPAICQPSGFYGGFEFLWLRPHFDQNVGMIIDPPVGDRMVPFDYDYEFSTRSWIGWQGANGGGVRGTYWQFDGDADRETATAVAGATPVFIFVRGAGGNLERNAYADLGETLTTTHELEMEAFDLEWTERMRFSSLEMLGGFGLRYARMDQNMRGEVYDAADVLQEVVTNDLRFEGVGPTASLQMWRPLMQSRFAFYGNLRGSLLFADTEQRIYEMKNGGADELVDVADQQEILSVGEMGLGLQYNHPLRSGALWYVRTGYEWQAWSDVGGPVDSESTLGFDGISLATGLLF